MYVISCMFFLGRTTLLKSSQELGSKISAAHGFGLTMGLHSNRYFNFLLFEFMYIT